MLKTFKKHLIFIVFVLSGVALYACQSTPFVDSNSESQTANTNQLINCKEPRRQACTREYRPVCAVKDTGVRCIRSPCPSTEQVTYSNACVACADKKVIGYQSGACL